MKKPNGYYTYEKCKEIALTCKNIRAFAQKNSWACYKSRQKGWLYDFFPIAEKNILRKPNGYWNYERCKEASLKYKSFCEFKTKNLQAYNKAKNKGWITDYVWLADDRGLYDTTNPIYVIYKYEWLETNAIYIGLTKNLQERDRSHRKNKTTHHKLSTVKKYADIVKLPIPKPCIIEENLTSQEAKIREDFWVSFYKENGNYIVLNKSKTGEKSSSIGGSIKKWTSYELCYREAQKYTSRTEFQKNAYGCYKVVCKNKWLDTFEWLTPKIHPNGYWNYENCYNEAKKYEYWCDFRVLSHSAYDSAKIHNWINDYTWLKLKTKPNGYWNYERCLEESKKYKRLVDFEKNSISAYNTSRRKKWINQIKIENNW